MIDAILPAQIKNSKARRAWAALFLLSPFAYLAGFLLNPSLIHPEHLALRVNRSQAIGSAQDYAKSLGWKASGSTVFSAVKPDETLYVYYRMVPPEIAAQLRALRPELVIDVVFLDPEGGNVFEASLTPAGQPLGFSARLPKSALEQLQGLQVDSGGEEALTAASELSLQEARRLVSARFNQRSAGIGFLDFDREPVVETDRSGKNLVRQFTWKGTYDGHPEVTVRLGFQVEGERIVSESVDVDLDPLYVSRELEHQSLAKSVMWVIFIISAVLFSIYAFVLYVRKALQKEVSHSRTVAVGVAIGLAFSLLAAAMVYETLGVQFKRTSDDPLFVVALTATVLAYLIMGLWIGMFWGSSEGEVRENYPGKLVSLDALILGKLFSQNVARAVVVGVLLGGWLVLASALVQLPWKDSPYFGLSGAKFAILLYSRFPGMLSLLSPLTSSVPVVAVGLLMPLTFSHRTFRSERYRRLVLGVLAFTGCSWIGLNLHPFAVGMLVTLTTVVALLASFRAYDLLVSLTMLSAYSFTTSMIALASGAPSGEELAAIHSVVVIALLGVLGYFAFQGKEYREEEEVRPLYAENLAQRLALQAEVSAAREAQLRLTPQEIPQMERFSLAACCQPGRVVGGDFYDFFPVNENQMGLFLAEGGGSGLSSALTIAYAKGLILPLLGRQPSPEAILHRLLDCMGRLVPAGRGEIGFLFGILENDSGTLRYARYGHYPQLLVFSPGGRQQSDPEREVFSGSVPFHSGLIQLSNPARVVLYTNGIADVLEINNIEPEQWLFEFMSKHPVTSAEQLQEHFLQALEPLVQRARRSGVEDDISAIFLRALEAGVKEQVA